MPVGLDAVLGIAVIAFGLVVIPGPNMLYLVSRSVLQGRRAGLTSLAGVALGFLIYLLAASAGLATLFALVPEIYVALKLAGAGYLLWLAWSAFRGDSVFATRELEPDRPAKLFGMGLLTCLLNPKIAILYISLLPQFLDPSRGNVAVQAVALGLTQLVVAVAMNALFVVTAGALASFLTARPSWMRVQRYLTGTVLAVFAIRLATDRARPVAT